MNLEEHLDTLHKALCTALSENGTQIDRALEKVTTLHRRTSSVYAQLSSARSNVAEEVKRATVKPIQIARLGREKRNADAVIKGLENALRITHVEDVVKVMMDAMEFRGVLEVLTEAVDNLWGEPLGRVEALNNERKRVLGEGEMVRARFKQEFRAVVAEGSLADIQIIVDLADNLEQILKKTGDEKVNLNLPESYAEMYVADEKTKLVEEISGITEFPILREICVNRVKYADQVLNKVFWKRDVKQSMSEKEASLRRSFCEAVQENLAEFIRTSYDDKEFERKISLGTWESLAKYGEKISSYPAIASEVEDILTVSKVGVVKGVIRERCSKFVDTIYKSHLRRLTQAIEEEKWFHATVDEGSQTCVNEIIALSEYDKGKDNEDSIGTREAISTTGSKKGEPEKQFLQIGGGRFLITKCVLQYVSCMHFYSKFSRRMPLVGPEAARRSAELTRQFNSLTGQAVLGAAALKTAGLRSITARHLALCSRSIAAVLALSPFIKKCLVDAARAEQLGMLALQIDQVDMDLTKHHEQLLAKILTIMIDRLKIHISMMKGMPWHDLRSMTGPGNEDLSPSKYMLLLVKETTVLHKIVWGILLQEETASIYGSMCAAYGERLSEAWGELDGFKAGVRQRVRVDVEYLYNNLRRLAVFEFDVNAFHPIEKLWKRFSSSKTTLSRGSGKVKKSSVVSDPGDASQITSDSQKNSKDESEQAASVARTHETKGPEKSASDKLVEIKKDLKQSEGELATAQPKVSVIGPIGSDVTMQPARDPEKAATGPQRTESERIAGKDAANPDADISGLKIDVQQEEATKVLEPGLSTEAKLKNLIECNDPLSSVLRRRHFPDDGKKLLDSLEDLAPTHTQDEELVESKADAVKSLDEVDDEEEEERVFDL